MFLKGTFLGSSLFSYTPIAQAYSNIKVYGEGESGYIKIWNYTPTDDECDDIYVYGLQEWDANTLMHASFGDDNTDGGNISEVTSLDNWLIFRRADDESVFTQLSTEDADTELYIDYTVSNGTSYKYQIYPVGSDKIGQPLETGFIEADIDYWYLIDEDNGVSYKMYLEMIPSVITTNKNVNYIQTQSKYPTRYNNGEMEYESSSISLVFGTVSDSVLDQNITDFQEFKSCIKNNNEKILKSKKGEVWRVGTSLNNTSNFKNTNIGEQPYVVNFDWVEVGEV